MHHRFMSFSKTSILNRRHTCTRSSADVQLRTEAGKTVSTVHAPPFYTRFENIHP